MSNAVTINASVLWSAPRQNLSTQRLDSAHQETHNTVTKVTTRNKERVQHGKNRYS